MKKTICILLVCLFASTALTASFAEADPLTYAEKDIQLDLAGMSGTVVYSMIYNMMTDPSQYIGKVIRIKGYYSALEYPEYNIVYHSCVIPDATACCAQGLEFVWTGEHRYPDDYPEPGTDMTVTGRLESYMEGQYMYLHLVNAEVDWKEPEV